MLVKSILGGEVYASGEMIDHVALLREFYAPFLDASPGMVGLGDCGILFTPLRNDETIAETFLVRHFSGI